MAKSGFIQGLIQSVMIGSGGDQSMSQIANMVGNYASMKYGRDQELESDNWGVLLMIEAGYDPEALITVMDILEESSGGSRVPEFQSSHPSPENRREKIREAIARHRGR
jgi:predicted Zn-dependent protease